MILEILSCAIVSLRIAIGNYLVLVVEQSCTITPTISGEIVRDSAQCHNGVPDLLRPGIF